MGPWQIDAAPPALWSWLHEPKPLGYAGFLKMFREPAERAGVEKPVTPTNLWKSNLAWLVRKGMNARSIERRQGRVHGSRAVARYVALFDSDVGEEYARLMGKEIAGESEEDRFGILVCPRCRKETPLSRDRCVWYFNDLATDEEMKTVDDPISLVNLLVDYPELIGPMRELNEAAKNVPGFGVNFVVEEGS